MSGRTIGLIGCGAWGQHILRDLRTLGATVVAVARSDASQARAREGGATVVGSLDELPEVDGVVVASPTVTHGEMLERLLPRSVPIFVEKPMTVDADQAERLARDGGDRLFVMDKWRYHPGIELLRDIAMGGELGSIIGLETTRIGWGNPHQDADGIWHLAPHDLAIALEVLGQVPEARAAVADTTADGPAGLVGILGERPWFAVRTSVRSPERDRAVVLRCKEGIAMLPDASSEHLLIRRRWQDADTPDDGERRPILQELPLFRELRAFLAHLDGGPPPRSSAAEGALIVRRIVELRALAGIDV